MTRLSIVRLGAADIARARETFALMTRVFEEPPAPLSDAYLSTLLTREDFHAHAAVLDGTVVGGITAHALTMTRVEARELFIYDLAVDVASQRRGIGRALMKAVQESALEAGMTVAFVPADNDDTDALDFYRAIGGAPAAVTIFTFDATAALPA